MPKTSYPDLTIKDDWNERTPAPVTSFADDVAKATKEPTLGLYHDPETGTFIETSAGAVPEDSDTAKAARDVAMKEPEEPEAGSGGAPSSGEVKTAEAPKTAAKSVSEKTTTTK